MVKNKKMSKSTLLIFALSVLLIISMIMSFTGAWFTATDTKQMNEAVGTSIRFGNIAVATITVSADEGDYAYDAQHVLPGDTIGGVEISVRLEHDVDVYATLVHQITVNNNPVNYYYYLTGGANNTTITVATQEIDLDGIDTSNPPNNIETILNNYKISVPRPIQAPPALHAVTYKMSHVGGIEIPATTQSTTDDENPVTVGDYTIKMGTEVTIEGATGTYILRVIQADNIAPVDAVTYLTTGTPSATDHRPQN